MSWRKSWPVPNLDPNGTKRHLLPHQRSVWDDCLDLAEMSPAIGTICVVPGVPYTSEQLSIVFKTPKHIVEESLNRFIQLKMISKDGRILQWKKYQSEYQRQKGYRRKLHNKVTSIGTSTMCNTDVDVDLDVDVDTDSDTDIKTTAGAVDSNHALRMYVPRLTNLLKGKGVSPESASAIARLSYREAARLLRPHPERLEPLMDELAGLVVQMPPDWYTQSIRGKVQHQLSEVDKRDVSTVKTVLEAAARGKSA